MFYIILALICAGIAALLFKVKIPAPAFVTKIAQGVMVALSALCIFTTSYINVPEDHFAVLNRIYFADTLPAGRVMMYDGEKTYKGPQPTYITSGFHAKLFVRVLNDISYVELTEVPAGQYLMLTAKEGNSLPDGEFMAPEWNLPVNDMIQPTVFLSSGGYKGRQLTVLPPGKYLIHPDLWSAKFGKALQVDTGEVAVIRSNVRVNHNIDCSPIVDTGSAGGDFSSTLVPNGCKGTWVDPIGPGAYYLNEDAFTVATQTTRALSWNYKGGYARREVSLKVDDSGNIDQTESSSNIPVHDSYADTAAIVRTKDGWTIPVEIRIIAQVYSKDAPRVIAGVGSLQAVEDRVVSPIVFDITRQIGGISDAKDLVNKRAEIVEALEQAVIPEAYKAGVTVQEVRLDEIVLPPELLLPGRRAQLATSLANTYADEKRAADQRAASERAKALADQQHKVVTAEMEAQAAAKRGQGIRDEMIQIAKGQEEQKNVIGTAATVQLQMLQLFLEAAKTNPDIIKVPVIDVKSNGDNNTDGMAAILGGSSNLAALMKIANEKKSN